MKTIEDHTTGPDKRPTTQLFDLLTEADTETPWLIKNFLIQDEQGMLHGREYTGKSYIALDLGLSLAAGLSDWHGFEIPSQQPVLYVPTEGIRGVSRRIATWARFKAYQGELEHLGNGGGGSTFEEVFRALPFERYDYALTLDPRSADSHKQVELLRRSIADQGARLVIFDVFSDFTGGLEENSSAFGAALKMLRPNDLGAAVLVVHHEGLKDKGRARGHSSILGAVDMRAAVSVLSQDNPNQPTHTVLKIVCKKQKNEDQFAPFALDLERPDDDLVTPLISGLNGAQTVAMRGVNFGPQVHAKFTDHDLIWFTQVHASVNLGGTTPKEIRDATGLGKSTEVKVRQRLISHGYVRNISLSGQPKMVPTPEGIRAVLG